MDRGAWWATVQKVKSRTWLRQLSSHARTMCTHWGVSGSFLFLAVSSKPESWLKSRNWMPGIIFHPFHYLWNNKAIRPVGRRTDKWEAHQQGWKIAWRWLVRCRAQPPSGTPADQCPSSIASSAIIQANSTQWVQQRTFLLVNCNTRLRQSSPGVVHGELFLRCP